VTLAAAATDTTTIAGIVVAAVVFLGGLGPFAYKAYTREVTRSDNCSNAVAELNAEFRTQAIPALTRAAGSIGDAADVMEKVIEQMQAMSLLIRDLERDAGRSGRER
jgi:hypothetical protein